MKRTGWLWVVVTACSGPAAPDAAVCQDLIQRVCAAPVCSAVVPALSPGADCAGSILARSGCAAPDFAFTTPTRDRFLTCRAPLVHAGSGASSLSPCDDIGNLIIDCPDVIAFLNGVRR